MKKKQKKNSFFKYLFYFVLFSFLGAFLEFILGTIIGKSLYYDRALYELFGIKFPFILLYGVGGLVLMQFNKFLDKKKIKFSYRIILNAVVMVISEFLAGIFNLLIYQHGFWDYSTHPLNLLGIVSLPVFFVWIFIGYLFAVFYKYIITFLNQFLL